MILVLLVLSTIALFLSFVYMRRSKLQLGLVTVLVVLVVASLVLVIRNDSAHLGMSKVTTTKTTTLKSAGSSQMDLLLYQSVGTADKNRVYIYKTTTNQKKVSHTPANIKTTNQVKTTAGTPKLVTKTTRWVYQNKAAKFWFGIADNDNQLIKRTNHFYVGKQWVVLSTSQAKQLTKLVKQQQKTLKARAKVYVANEVKAAMVKNPSLSQTQLAQLEKQAAAKYQASALQSMIKTVKQSH
ncbi:DUF4811 domain-containing protein [Lactobacillus sp. CBA3606]|uniref:DUF4811 domain-containing protein n=1 Tax=Lactobacillus sp. CBA3606 TaxID=2099789 RepID=UPI000CFCF673|nr:DUF4811 domain-containing protein [Lactobacillus sp. CBA3606]AVK64717.1 DUF4811 domain-containing protein [Lactobacillus sp. CBA3606]